jgi:hypothetical protein
MATVDKNFKVKNGLVVEGNNITLGSTPISFNAETNKLQIYIDGSWQPIAFFSEIPDATDAISFMDIGLAIDYNGQPIYTVQANGVNPTATKFADGGTPSTSSWSIAFDSGNIS